MVLGHFEEQIPFLKEKGEKKRGNARVCKEEWLGLACFSFLAPKGPNNIQEEI